MEIMNTTIREEIYTVTRLNNEARFLLEDTFPLLWIEGEISNFSAPHSGHWYFSLKDANAQISCAMFKGNQRKLAFTPKDGAHVLLKARVSLYENTGRFQLIAEDMEERGEGKLRRAFLLLQQKLAGLGWFDSIHKKPFPPFPQQIGVITSATGAAIRDILNVLNRRYACVSVIIYPTLVQGNTAAQAIVEAIKTANRRKECDVLILARGGGSLEDLWPFNEEIVAKAIYDSELPIMSGIGHEVDFTIADFVADKRAPTPSAAAEMITPDCEERLHLLTKNKLQLIRQMQNALLQLKNKITWTEKHLMQQHPKRRLTEKMQRLDFCELALVQQQNRLLNQLQTRLKDLRVHLTRLIPLQQIHLLQNELNVLQQRLLQNMIHQYNQKRLTLGNLAATLDTLSPLATLKRGYAIALTNENNIIRNAQQIKIGDQVNVRLSHNMLVCKIEKIELK